MTPQEWDNKIHEIASRVASLPKKERTRKLADEVNKLPGDIKETLRPYIAFQVAKLDKVTEKKWLEKMGSNQWLLLVGLVGGIGMIATASVMALSILTPTPLQYLIIRCLIAGGFAGFSVCFVGTMNINVKWKVVAIAGTGGFGVFILIYFWNPPEMNIPSQPPAQINDSDQHSFIP